MRIGLSTSVVQRGKTGIAQYVFALVRALLSLAPQHRLVLFVLHEDLPLFEFARKEVELVPVPEEHRAAVKNILWHQTALPQLARSHRLDVLHVPSYRRLLWPKPCPLVATIHDLAPFRVSKKRMLYGRVVARRLAQRQDAIIAISENTARDIIAFFKIPRERLTVVPNGIEHERFFPGCAEEARKTTAQKFGIRHPFFLYVARLEHPGKNHVRLVSAFDAFKAATQCDWHLVFGGSDWHGAEAIHAAIKQSPFARDIHCLGFVPDQDLPNWYRAADTFVYPSLYEGFGMPPLEAMACGCPVIASARGSLGEVLGEAAAIIEPEEVHDISNQLCRLATDTSVRERLRAAGLAQAARFDWRRTAKETLKVYETVAQG